MDSGPPYNGKYLGKELLAGPAFLRPVGSAGGGPGSPQAILTGLRGGGDSLWSGLMLGLVSVHQLWETAGSQGW